MRYLKYVMLLVLAALLSACGGGGNPGSAGTTTPTATTVASIELLASSTTLDSADSTTGVTITAFVKNASNIGVSSQAVSFSATSGVLGNVSATSDSNGRATAALTTGADHSNRNITVMATVGSVSKSIVIAVSGTTMTITGNASMLIGANSVFAVTLKDSGGNVISGPSLTVTSSLGNAISASTLTAGSTGASFTYTATNAGSDTLTVTGAGTSAQYAVTISSTNFSFVAPNDGSDIDVGAVGQTVSVRLLPAVAGQTINFSSTRGTVSPSTATTDVTGLASTTARSTTAGSATITAQAVVTGSPQTRRAVNFVATVPSTLVLQTNVSAIAPNTSGSTTNTVTLTATVRDAASNPVKNQTVNFSLVDTSGGYIGTGTGVTDANGIVTDTFVPGSTSTAANGVVVTATVASNTSIFSTATITVSARALFVTIATSNTIANLDENTYSKPFSVYVNDANGAAVANQTIVLSAYPLAYGKGVLTLQAGSWKYFSFTGCINEDVNRDGILGTKVVGGFVVSEDTNGDGVLTPGLPGVISPSTVITDSTGLATFKLNYGEQYAPWLTFEIKATTTVSGTESKAIYSYTAAGSAADFSSDTPPAGQSSPFGISTSCLDAL